MGNCLLLLLPLCPFLLYISNARVWAHIDKTAAISEILRSEIRQEWNKKKIEHNKNRHNREMSSLFASQCQPNAAKLELMM